jgi:hypothetical protein
MTCAVDMTCILVDTKGRSPYSPNGFRLARQQRQWDARIDKHEIQHLKQDGSGEHVDCELAMATPRTPHLAIDSCLDKRCGGPV